ncbi:MAG: hypothetical protein E7C93_00455 [Veillonella sp.]|uniref:hypothetical protein n=1 Tax=Veillonella sp. TaxID=1926307 RepID=UPI00257F4D13|nr:hypothetical protein [Veillonella sp.]MDU2555542.1 hypothetical protein [Veillonella sp.]MDU2575996.1 hypothetical protein [Veillonella sp.]
MDNTVTKEQLLTTAKEQWPDAADYIYSENGDNMLDEFMKGKFYVDGKFVEPQAKEPTKAEKIAEIRNYYNGRFETLEQMLLRRRLINGDITDLQDQFKKLNQEMVLKIKAVK